MIQCLHQAAPRRMGTDQLGTSQKRLTHSEQPVLITLYCTLITWQHTPGVPQYDTTCTLSAGLDNRATKTTGFFYPSVWSTARFRHSTHPFYYVCLRAFKRIPQETERISEGGIRQEEWIYLMGLMDTQWK